jgi:hypothetical protein
MTDRDVLGDHDQNEWPYDYNGKQSDPWVHTVYIPMVTRDGKELFTFSTHSFFGREAAYRLMQHYAARSPQHKIAPPGHHLAGGASSRALLARVSAPRTGCLASVGWPVQPRSKTKKRCGDDVLRMLVTEAQAARPGQFDFTSR